MVLANLIGGFIVILVGTSLMPEVGDSVNAVIVHNKSLATNTTGAAATVVGLTTLFFALGVMASGISLAAMGLKNAGMF